MPPSCSKLVPDHVASPGWKDVLEVSVSPSKRVLHQIHLPKGVRMDRSAHNTCQTAFVNDVQCVRSLAMHVTCLPVISVIVPAREKISKIQT